MNIIFLVGDISRKGGTERMTALLSNELCKRYNVFIFSFKMQGRYPFFEISESVELFVSKSNDTRLGIMNKICEMHRLIVSEKIDWVINVDVGMGIYGIVAAVGTKAKVITWEHSNYFNNWNSRIFPYIRKFAAKYSDVLVVLTKQDKKNYQDNIHTIKPIYVIGNPIEKKNYVYDTESKTILSAGLLVPIKGFEMAVQVAARILPDNPEWRWIICGDGPERDRLQTLINNKHLEKQMILVGTVSDMDEMYKNSAMFVMTSKMEGLPMVLLEAKSWGLPLVSFDIMTGPSELIENNINGFLIDAFNIDEMVSKIKLLIEKNSMRQRFSDNNGSVIEYFEKQFVLKQWMELLGEK